MVIYRHGEKTIRKEGINKQAIIELDFENGLIIYAFPGDLSPNDLLIRFFDSNIPRSRTRQPSHIHWAVDLLIKKDNNNELVINYLDELLARWENIQPLEERNFNTILDNLVLSQDEQFIERYNDLNEHGFFPISFITHLIEILILQEKTNNPNAYMFKNVVDKIISSNDLYSIISNASFRGRR